jgi:hypothetical protein
MRTRLVLDPKRDRAIEAVRFCTTLGVSVLCQAHLPSLFRASPSCPLLSRLLPGLLTPMRVVERIVDLSAYPQVVQKHRELSSYGHYRSLL